jgi:hypothetical protein
MSRCTVCGHPERAEIDRLMVTEPSNLAVGDRFGLSKDAVRRHRRDHLSPALKAVLVRREQAGARSGTDWLAGLMVRAEKILDTNEQAGHSAMSLAAIKELRGLVELWARLTGELDERPQVNVGIQLSTNPEWLRAAAVIEAALAPYPEAARAVAAALFETQLQQLEA